MEKAYDLGSVVEMKKPHACQTNAFVVIRVGADIKIKCCECNHVIMLSRREFEKKLKRVHTQP